MTRTVREIIKTDINLIIDYFLNSTPEFLTKMGVDVSKLPGRMEWSKIILDDLERPPELKKLYYVTWEIDGIPLGHSNINNIIFGNEAYMHLHLWDTCNRGKGDGTWFIKQSLFYYFNIFKLKKIFCQPYALNVAPNKTLRNAGFTFIKKYETTPGWLNFKQWVNLWVLDSDNYQRNLKSAEENTGGFV
jgi:RimJ/RimL family protein N-acetyltransferase